MGKTVTVKLPLPMSLPRKHLVCLTYSEQSDVHFLGIFFLNVLIYMRCNLFDMIIP